jgi:DNA-binding SARP family transcriptional activator/ABC-type branched-subunit amino acid transport system substrate-binding protein/streptogramin lyase
MQFRLLGPLEVDVGGEPIVIAAPKQRALLALLLLHHGERLSVDRIADALWGDAVPATATKTVQVYVAQLRKALGDGLLVTEPGGYRAELDGHGLDAVLFERLLDDGTRLLEEDDTAAARETLEAALALWRGSVLPDVPDENAARRLEEQRLLALERRIDADLALGRHDRVIGELQELVAREPLRERPRAQLMLALYRSGRQAEALDVYGDGRRRLVDELGLEPGPELQALERAILTQDATVAAPRPRRPLPNRGAGRRWGRVAGAGAAAVAAVAAVVAAALLIGNEDRPQAQSVRAGDFLAAIDARSYKIVDTVPTGRGPSTVTAGAGAVWTLNADDRTITRLDTATGERRTLGVGAIPTDFGFGLGSLWVGTAGSLRGAQFAGRAATGVVRLDPNTGIAADPIALPPARGVVSNGVAHHLAFAGGAAWMINPDFSLSRIEPARNEVAAALTHVTAVAVAGDGRRLWVLNDDRTIARVDPRTDRVVKRIRVPATDLSAIAVGAGAVWALDPGTGRLWRIEPNGQQLTIDVGTGADALAFGGGAVWVTNSLLGQVLRIDPLTDRVTRRIPLGGTPRDVTVVGDRVWVAVAGGAPAARPARLGGVRPVASPSCGPPLAGSATPRLLVASDLPLQAGLRFPVNQMAAAVVSVLRAHGFRAGKFPLAFQSCDDSIGRTQLFDAAKCAANARAYAATPALVGVIGPMNSECALAQVPIASRASLAVISPTTTAVDLTRPESVRDERRLRPTGIRTFARVVPPDDAEGAAEAVLMQRLGSRRPFVLHDGGWGAIYAEPAARALRRLHIPPAGVARWDWRRRHYEALARRVRAARADGVVICGLLDTDVGAVLRKVRPVLPAGAPVVGCEALLPVSLLFKRAGASARGVHVTRVGLATASLPPAGRELARRLGRDTDVMAIYAAAATEALLDAIAASDGTRASISAHLMQARREDSPIGPYAIDANGDPHPAPVSVFRLEQPGGSNAINSEDGARVLAPIVPPRRLWAGG